jgi:hypothetical protein
MIMPKELLNEAERFLVEHWGEARLLEESMESVRTKYKEVFERIIEAVTEGHPELDAHRIYPTQFWGSGSIGFGRKSWPEGGSNWPSGLWVSNLRLEILAAEDSEPPYASIWVPKRRVNLLDYDTSRVAVEKAAEDLLSPEELKRTDKAESGEEVLLYLPAPSKVELRDALSDGDGQKFVELFVSQFDLMARFVPVLDKVFHECLRKE